MHQRPRSPSWESWRVGAATIGPSPVTRILCVTPKPVDDARWEEVTSGRSDWLRFAGCDDVVSASLDHDNACQLRTDEPVVAGHTISPSVSSSISIFTLTAVALGVTRSPRSPIAALVNAAPKKRMSDE